eukprot:TRINITY_DN3514_c1_g1_i1.p1 TRINITY_DN3514_c1_g1~~TRINITY_DN3514_c1_g1_i1.p1  ORF type:complete len:514 (+),score=61.99 TRINITY_DN3514_c1_g1_i1:520-2061(+)
MPPRMEPGAKRAYTVSETSSWRGKPLSEYSPMFGRLPPSCQPVVDVDSDGCSIVVGDTRGRSSTKYSVGGRPYHAVNEKEEYTDDDLIYDEGSASILASTVALVKSILGIGLVSMPYICSMVGTVNYCLFLAVFMLPSHFSNICLAKTVDLVLGPWNGGQPKIVDRVDYLTLGVLSFGSKSQWWILVFFLIVIWGGTVSLFIALHDILIGYVEHIDVLGNSWVLVTLIAAVVFPLCCLDTLHALRHTSYVGIVGIAALSASLWYRADRSHHGFSDMDSASFEASNLSLLPVFIFSYMGQFNFIRVYCELQRRTPKRVSVVSSLSLFVSFLFYALTGVGGYLAFMDGTKQDVFGNLQHLDDVATHISKVLFAASLMFTAPVYLFEARNMIEDLIAAMYPVTDEFGEVVQTRSISRRVAVVMVLLVTMVVVAVSYPHVVQVLGLLGATTSTMMMVIFPPIFLIKISRFLNRPLSPFMMLSCKAFAVSGFVAVPTFTAFVLWKLVDPAPSPAPIDT